MRSLLLLWALAACDEIVTDEPWQLDHDRLLAVRSAPPHIATGEIALLDALVAHGGGPTTVEAPRTASAAFAPADLFDTVQFYIDHWRIEGPDESRLVAARQELGLAAGAPVHADERHGLDDVGRQRQTGQFLFEVHEGVSRGRRAAGARHRFAGT